MADDKKTSTTHTVTVATTATVPATATHVVALASKIAATYGTLIHRV